MLGVGRDGSPPLLEQILERTIKGLDVEIINRGFSGELAEAAGTRLKVEVALNHPDLVLWQVGTNDAFAQVPVEAFQRHRQQYGAVAQGAQHRRHPGRAALHQAPGQERALSGDPRQPRRIATAESVLRIGRYEAMEVLARTMRESGRRDPGDFGFSEAGYNCMAQYIARAMTVGLFAKPPKAAPPAPPTR